MRYDDWLMEGLDDRERALDSIIYNQEAIADRARDILECDGEIYDAVYEDDDTAAGRQFWESLREMAEHGKDADDVQFIEASRGVYDALIALADQKAEREGGDASE